jgi:hypothetical protein
VKKSGKAGVRSVVVGFVQGTTVTSNGVAEQPGAKARRVGVTVEYRTK